MRFRTAVTIGHPKPEPPRNLKLNPTIGFELGLRLTALNDDCLLLICEQLSLGDQLRLLQLQEERLCHLVLRLWCGKYAKQFDWNRDRRQLKQLSPDELTQLLDLLGNRTRALLNLPGSSDEGCRKWLKQRQRRRCQLTHLQRLSFRKSDILVIQTVPIMCSNLMELRLGEGEHLTSKDLNVLFEKLPNLRAFELRSIEDCEKHGTLRNFPPNLEILKLPACLLNSSIARIFTLVRLRLLTGFLCRSSERFKDSDDGDKANASSSGIGTLNACLRELGTARGHCHIVGLRLQCRLDDSLPSASAFTDVLRLRHFAWHSQLTVHYDVADGSIRWRPQRPQAVLSLLPFIASQEQSLRELDFTRNAHATPTFLAQLSAHLRQSNGCHSCHSHSLSHFSSHSHCPKMTDTDTAETNDLAFVELELLHLPNEQTEVEVGTGEMRMAMRDYHPSQGQ
ncbi:uncharacterized protein LOC110185182 [Drosophila serrata]|uniref:uncharacterized protein LOC110185182 n=1 Tax=Drosophila serrata TaxID=7274 RepID=UPI000A1CF399|nr:uncharacterized protein LOC110185182 [Drosophila serrata]